MITNHGRRAYRPRDPRIFVSGGIVRMLSSGEAARLADAVDSAQRARLYRWQTGRDPKPRDVMHRGWP
jgi:hypothetical protein